MLYHVNCGGRVLTFVMQGHLKAVKNRTRRPRDLGRVEGPARAQRHCWPPVNRVIAVSEYEAFHVIERVTRPPSHEQLGIPSEIAELTVHHPYPPHLITTYKR